MPYRDPIVITGPSVEPITLAEALAHCNIDTVDDGISAQIENVWIPAARDFVEWRTGITVHEKTLELVLDEFDCDVIELPGATPLIEIVTIKYRDSAGTETTMSASEYAVSEGSQRRLGRVSPAYGMSWPSFTAYPMDAVKIRYRAGIAITSPLTEASATIKQACGLLVAGMFENRESEIITDRAAVQAISMSYGVEAMLARLRVEFGF